MGGGNVQPNTSVKPDFGTTSIPYRRSKDGASWWQHLVIVLIKDLVIFLTLAGLILMHIVRMDPMVSNMEAKALLIGAWWQQHLVIALIKDLVIFFILGGLMLMHIVRMDPKVSNMEAKALGILESLDKFFSDNERLSKEESDRLSEDYDKRKIGSDGNVDLNEVVLMKDIVTKEIEKRAADGFERVVYDVIHSVKAKVIHILGIPIRFPWGNWRVVYAVIHSVKAKVIHILGIPIRFPWGNWRVVYAVIHSVKAKVIHILGIPIRFPWGNWRVVYDVIHSVKAKVIHILGFPIRFRWRNWVHHDLVRMLTPSFREGGWFELNGKCGSVRIDLTKAIIPRAVTIEHADKCNRRNRYAPKDCRVYGWFSRREVTPDSRMYFLGNFTYDLEKSSPQTFNVSDSAGIIDIIRLEFTSNHGNPSSTCIYRFSVHGYAPD